MTIGFEIRVITKRPFANLLIEVVDEDQRKALTTLTGLKTLRGRHVAALQDLGIVIRCDACGMQLHGCAHANEITEAW